MLRKRHSVPQARSTTQPGRTLDRLLTVPAVLLLTTAALFGCSTVHGSAAKHNSGAEKGTLQPGNYPTEPRPDLGKAGDRGLIVDAQRMATFVVQPYELDARLTVGVDMEGYPDGPLWRPDILAVARSLVFPDEAKNNSVSQFIVTRDGHEKGGFVLNHLILRYKTPQDAVVAATALGEKGGPDYDKFEYRDSRPQFGPTPIPRHPDARALAWEGYLVSYTPHDVYVLIDLVEGSARGLDQKAEMIATSLDKQIPLIDQFTPTPADQLANLPLDPEGLLARTVEPAPEERDRPRYGLYSPQGYLAFSESPAEDQKLLTDAGVDLVAFSGTTVFRARDADSAKSLVEAWATARGKEEESSDLDAPPGLGGAHCFKQLMDGNKRYAILGPKAKKYDAFDHSCLFNVGRYAVDVHGLQKTPLYQRASAQYLLLSSK